MRADRRAGFTFLELLVAVAILGASFTVLLTAHGSASRQEARARRLMTATLLAREILMDTEVEGYPALGGDEGDFGEEYPEYTWERTVNLTPYPRAREVWVQVNWPERGRTESVSFVFYAVGDEP